MVDTYDATLVRQVLMELPTVIHNETGDDAVANLTLQLCFQAVRFLDENLTDRRKAEEVDNMFANLITTDEEPTYEEEPTWQESSPLPNETL